MPGIPGLLGAKQMSAPALAIGSHAAYADGNAYGYFAPYVSVPSVTWTANDIVIAILVAVGDNPSVTPPASATWSNPAGWTQIGSTFQPSSLNNGPYVGVFWKKNPSIYDTLSCSSISSSDAAYCDAAVMVIQNANSIEALNTTTGSFTGTSGTMTATSGSLSAGSTLVYANAPGKSAGLATVTIPSGMTGNASGPGGFSSGALIAAQLAPGVGVQTKSSTSSGNQNLTHGWATFMFGVTQ